MYRAINFSYSDGAKKIVRSFFFYILSLIVFSFVSCSKNSEEKKEKTEIKLDSLVYDDNGNLFTGRMKGKIYEKKIEYDVVDGKKNGEFKLYHENGILEMEGKIKDNKNTGLWRYYYNDGELESEGSFKNDLAEGKWLWYYPSGKLKESAMFKDGVREGKTIVYDESGNIVSEKLFSNGLEVNE